jgi:uncharacterized protein involved in exopolysaccharide biosynthesis
MLDTYAAAQDQTFYDERPGQTGLAHYLEIAKRRWLYFLIPFILVLGAGALVIAIQRSIYLAEGRILVESQDIPADLVRPTVMDTANQRIQVIQQRIMTRDNLLAIVNKFGLFTSQRKWMSASQLLDLMRDRTKLELVDLSHPTQQNNLTIALKLSFEYENPELAMRVANEFLTLILAADARTRITRATETTKFLAREVARIEGDLGAVDAQIAQARQRPPELAKSDELGTELTKLKADLLQKSSLYSNAHPEVRALKRKVAALEQAIAKKPPEPEKPAETGLYELAQQRLTIEKNLEEANRKLTAARLGESLERDQQSERLQVIEQPTVPQKPVKPNRMKLLTMAFILAGMVGMGTVIAAESLDRTIRNAQQLFGVVDSHLIVAIPYISTRAETARRKRRIVLALLFPFILIGAGVAALFYLGLPGDLSLWFEGTWTDTLRSWFDTLTRLSK